MPEKEIVDLELRSKIPSRSDLAGFHHSLKFLNQIERSITRINAMTIAPRGIAGAQAASAATAINAQATAVERLVAAQGKLLKTQNKTHTDASGASVVTRSKTEQIAPGQTRKTTVHESGATDVDEITNLAKIAKIRDDRSKLAAAEKAKFLKSKLESDSAAARETAERSANFERMNNSAKPGAPINQQAELALADASANAEKEAHLRSVNERNSKARKDREARELKNAEETAKHRDSVRAAQQKIFSKAESSANSQWTKQNQIEQLAPLNAKIEARTQLENQRRESITKNATKEAQAKVASAEALSKFKQSTQSQNALKEIQAKEKADKNLIDLNYRIDQRNKKAASESAKALKEQNETIKNVVELDRKKAELLKQGFRSAGMGTYIKDSKGRITNSDVFERFVGDRRETAKITTQKNSAGNFIGGSMQRADSALPPGQTKSLFQSIANVGAYASAATVLYGSLQLARQAAGSLLDTGLQTARLNQVYRGVGGSVGKLADDTMRLAAAENRNRDEAMESAVQWSRLGGNRMQINEGVRVSLRAANVAEMTASEGTEVMTSIMQGYRLEVGQLAGKLGEINSISNRWNITNKDLLQGLSRVAPIARQAGLSFEETIGIIAAGRGSTGMTGPNFGNALKSIIGSLADTNVQKMLRDKFKIEVTTKGGSETKDMSQILQDLFLSYQKLSKAEQQHLTFAVAGKNQAARFTAILDSYVRSQVLAINAQMNLNSAEKESATIRGALKSQLVGVVTEWERFINLQGKASTKGAGFIAETMKNMLHFANAPVVSDGISIILPLLGALAVKAAFAAMSMKNMGMAGSFVGRSMNEVRNAARDTMGMVSGINKNFVAGVASGGRTGIRGRASGIAAASVDFLENKATRYGIKADIAAMSSNRLAGGWRAMSVSARLLGGSIATLAGFVSTLLVPMLLIGLAAKAFNAVTEGMSSSAEDAERKLAGFSDEAERLAGVAGAASMSMKLMDTVMKTIGSKTTPLKMKTQAIKEASEVAFFKPDGSPDADKNSAWEKEVSALTESGRENEAVLKIEALKSQMATRGMMARYEELHILEQQSGEIRSQIKALESKSSLSKAQREELTNLKQRETDNKNRRTGTLVRQTSEMDEDISSKLAADEKHLAFKEREKLIAQSLATIYQEIAGSNPAEKHNAEIDAKEKELDYLKKTKAAMENDPNVARQVAIEKAEAIKKLEEDTAAKKKRLSEIPEYFSNPGEIAIPEFSQRNRDFTTGIFGDTVGGFLSDKNDQRKVGGTDKTVAQVSNEIKERRNLNEEIHKNTKLINELNAAGGDNMVESAKRQAVAIKELSQAILDKGAVVAGMKDDTVRALVEQQERNQSVLRSQRNDSAQNATGANDAERIQSQLKWLDTIIQKKGLIADIDGKILDKQQSALYQYQAINEQVDLRHSKEQMIAKLHADQVNTAREMNREFQKGLLMSGPAELLRKLAVKQLVDKGDGKMSLGSFMSLDPAARKDAQDYSPSLNPRVQDIARQLRTLGPRQTIRGDLQDMAISNAHRNVLRSDASPSMGGITTAINVRVHDFGTEVGRATGALQTFIATLTPKASPSGKEVAQLSGHSEGPFV